MRLFIMNGFYKKTQKQYIFYKNQSPASLLNLILSLNRTYRTRNAQNIYANNKIF